MRTIQLKGERPDDEIELLAGSFLDDSHYDTLVDADCDVLKPNGEVLMKFRENAVPPELCELTIPIWDKAANPTDNRGLAAGAPEIGEDGFAKTNEGRVRILNADAKTTKLGAVRTRFQFLKQDGTVSKKTVAKTVNSGIVGFMDGNPRYPYCRLTAFTMAEMDKFNQCLPVLQILDAKFKELMPERHAAQMEVYGMSSKDFLIPGTSFSTITVNKTFRTAVHTDQGDLKRGFGVMSCFRKGEYTGGYLIFPKYRVAVNMTTGCICCADVHSYHGNSEMVQKNPFKPFKRISLVCYFREKITTCGTAEQEREKAEGKQIARFTKQGELFNSKKLV